MRLPPDMRRRLTEIGRAADDEVPLADGALTLAMADRPGIPLEPYRRHLDRLVDEVRAYVGGTEPAVETALRAEGLVQVLARRYGYGGTEDTFDDLDAANLTRVIDSRAGLPVAIGILYIHVARALGWAMSGLDFPGRFMVRLEKGGERRILDPFAGGREMQARDLRDMFKAVAGSHVELAPQHYRPMSNRKILLRLQGNIKSRLLRARRLEDALEVLEAMVLFAPAEAELWREVGLLHARLDNVAEAVAALETYLKLCGAEARRYNTSLLLQELRRRLN